MHYEQALHKHVGEFRKAYELFRDEDAELAKRRQGLLEKCDEVIDEINRMVGFSPHAAEQARQRRTFSSALNRGGFSNARAGLRFYLVLRGTIKDYLRSGGSLPAFAYDKTTDSVQYSLQLFDAASGEAVGIALPVKASESGEKEIRAFFAMLSDGIATPWMAFHVPIQLAISGRIRPVDPHFRWFRDGCSSAIASRFIRKYLGAEAAQEFAALCDVAQFADLEKHLNLSYWMSADYTIETPLETEKRLRLARQAYSTLEAERLMGLHGVDCLRRILEKVDTEKANHSRRLFPAILEVTGADLEKRFQRYQSFASKAEGIAHYSQLSQAAIDREDYAEALPALLRSLEITPLEDPRFYSDAAWVLFRMGHEEMGDRAILNHADFCKQRSRQTAYVAMHKLFIDYALKCRNLERAGPSAQEVLKVEPEYVPALAVEMSRVGKQGDPEAAREIARRILKVAKNPENPWRQLALQVERSE